MRQLPLGVIIAETQSRKLLFTNQRAQELLGAGASERSIAGPHAELIHLALAGESTSDREIDVIRADGSRGLVSLSAEPVRDADGEIVAAVATLFDLTEHRQREEALAFLAEASVVLAETLDLQQTLTDLVELAVPRLADWCTIDMLDHGEIRNVGVAHADPDMARLARRLHARRPAARTGLERRLGGARERALAADQRRAAPGSPGRRPRRGAADAGARARRALVDRRPARRTRPRLRRAHARDRPTPGGASPSRIWRSPRISRAAPRSRSRTRGSTAPSTTSRTRCSRASSRRR